MLAVKHPGIKIMIIRKTYAELTANHIRPLKELLRLGMPGNPIKYNDSRKEIFFPNGSLILFGYCDSENDVELMGLIPNSVCVANAMPEVAARAYATIPSDVDDGPAQLMEALAETGGDLDAALAMIG